jgi:hypothetical protein
MRTLSLGLLVLTIPVALLARPHREVAVARARGTVDLRLSSIASELARRPVRVRCEGARTELMDLRGESGSVEFVDGRPTDDATLKDGICATLHLYSQSTKRGPSCLLPCDDTTPAVVWSLNTLAHESYHLRGIRDEATTQCYALQAIGFVARRLGASRFQADALGAWATTNLPQRMPPEYTSPACHEGGALDLRPASRVWP